MTILVLALCFITYWMLKDSTDRGTFGDMFGSANAIFSGLAFAGLIYTILLQKEELGLQRTELKETRNEFHIQNETLKKQQFESTLFKLINLHHEIINNLSLHLDKKYNPNHIEKRDVIKKASIDLNNYIESSRVIVEKQNMYGDFSTKPKEIETLKDEEESLKEAYENFWNEYYTSFSHYFRNMYHVFKFIHLSNILSNEEKRFYATIMRSQLSSDEQFLLFYNSLVEGYGYPNFLFLIKEYDIFQNFEFSMIKYKGKEIFDYKLAEVSNPFS